MLLYPERGLVLNATAADVVRLCTGEHTVGGIVDAARPARTRDEPREDVEREVLGFLGAHGRARAGRWQAMSLTERRAPTRWSPS